MKPKVLVLAVLLVSAMSWTIASSGATGGSGEEREVSAPGVGARAIREWRTFRSTVHDGTTYRVSRTGNVYSAESPTGIDHIDSGAPVEGYCLRYTPEGLPSVEAYDVGDSRSGFGSATRSSSAPWKVTRTTSDGALQLAQVFSFDGPAKELQVRITLKNVSGGSVSNIALTRLVDFDVDVGGSSGFANAADNWVAVTEDTLLAWSDAAVYTEPHGMLLQLIREPSTSGGQAVFDNSPTTCAAGLFIQGPHKGDDVGGVSVGFGSLDAGAKRSATVRFARY